MAEQPQVEVAEAWAGGFVCCGLLGRLVMTARGVCTIGVREGGFFQPTRPQNKWPQFGAGTE